MQDARVLNTPLEESLCGANRRHDRVTLVTQENDAESAYVVPTHTVTIVFFLPALLVVHILSC
jgi:hypothetical protein